MMHQLSNAPASTEKLCVCSSLSASSQPSLAASVLVHVDNLYAIPRSSVDGKTEQTFSFSVDAGALDSLKIVDMDQDARFKRWFT